MVPPPLLLLLLLSRRCTDAPPHSMEPDAEARCESYVTEALLLAPSSPEALQTLASIRISQQRPADAVAALQRSFNAWKHLTAGTGSDNETIPTYASRINLAKLLIETAQHETALDVLERLQAEDDQLPDLWYLGGWCLFLLGQQEEEQGGGGRAELWAAGREWLRGCEAVGFPPSFPLVWLVFGGLFSLMGEVVCGARMGG